MKGTDSKAVPAQLRRISVFVLIGAALVLTAMGMQAFMSSSDPRWPLLKRATMGAEGYFTLVLLLQGYLIWKTRKTDAAEK